MILPLLDVLIALGRRWLTGRSIFTRHDNRVLDGIPFPGWALTTWNDRAHL